MSETEPTPVEMVRLLVSDVDDDNPVLTDIHYLGFLAIEGQSVKRAAAAALDAIATSEALISKVIKTQDLQTNGPQVAAALRAHATTLRAQAVVDEGDAFGMDIVDFVPYRRTPAELTEYPSYGCF